jgi:hypothetical protein
MTAPLRRLALVSIVALVLASQLHQSSGTFFFQNVAREMARNQVMHILRHYPDLLMEVLQQQQMQQMLLQQQQSMNNLNNQQGLNLQQQRPLGPQLPFAVNTANQDASRPSGGGPTETRPPIALDQIEQASTGARAGKKI